MTDDEADVCGHPTAGGDGPPCQNPAGDNGRCHIQSHNPDDDRENPGRPSKFDDETARAAIDAVPEQKTKSGVERAIGVGQGTLEGWLQKDLEFVDESGERRDFSKAFRQARARVQADLVNEPLYEAPDEAPPGHRQMDGQHARYLLASSYGLTKTEKREVEDVTEGGFGGGTEIVVSGEYDPNPDDGNE